MLERGEGVGERLAVRVVEVHADLRQVHAFLDEGGEQALHMAGGGHADRVAETHLVAAHVDEGPDEPGDLVDGDGALPRVAEAHRQIAPDMEPFVAGAGDDRLEHGE